MAQREIRNVLLAGVHTNMCVLGRPSGLRNMARFGKASSMKPGSGGINANAKGAERQRTNFGKKSPAKKAATKKAAAKRG